MLSEIALTAVIAVLFSAIHVAGPALRFLQRTPRSIWLSAAGGVAVAYVFVHLLPELAAHQDRFGGELEGGFLAKIESHIYLIALLGLCLFYGLDRMARTSALKASTAGAEPRPASGVFWSHLAAFAAYNVLIGYLLLHREAADDRSLGLYAVAMGLHFVVNDQGLRQQHGPTYDHRGRWILAAAPLVGWGLGRIGPAPTLLISSLFAFLAGGVVLNVLKEELPEDRESRFFAFAAGAAIYAALLLASR